MLVHTKLKSANTNVINSAVKLVFKLNALLPSERIEHGANAYVFGSYGSFGKYLKIP
jgi:hypothetical protein